MLIICENEDERDGSKEANSIGIVVCVGRIGRCLERKHIRGFRSRIIGIRNYGGIFDRYKERVQRRR